MFLRFDLIVSFLLTLPQPIERVQRKFNPLRVPKKLQKDLPFKSKPKDERKQTNKTYLQKRAVVMETDEKKVSSSRFWLAVFFTKAQNKIKYIEISLKRTPSVQNKLSA